jgi:bifunctional non-homologous end joining protein LigD
MSDPLGTYRRKRDPGRTPEPVPPEGPLPAGNDDTFVIQEHHARRLHWDVRLERDGVLVSWAVPRGVPTHPERNHLAVHTEDHPLEYASFAGDIPSGEYGGGKVTIWDRGTYECEKWTDREVKVVFHGTRARGRYVFFRTRGNDWMLHRMDPPEAEAGEPLPELVRPMLATPGTLPTVTEDPVDEPAYGYEMKWDGVRAVAYVDGGRVRLLARSGADITATYPELRALGLELGSRRCILDGEIVAFDSDHQVSFAALQSRMHVADAARARRLAQHTPVTYVLFDVLHLDGHETVALPYEDRRVLLEDLGLSGPRWQTPPYLRGGGPDALAASRDLGLEGVVAKRLASAYHPGARAREWIKVKHVRAQEVVIGGWKPGSGRREGTVGSLLVGVHSDDGELAYAGHVGTGFTDAMLADLLRRLRKLERRTAPFDTELPRSHAKDARWVTPKLVGEVVFAHWTRDGLMRAPSWRGLRTDKSPGEVVRES